ncbi:MAG: hypothetical protein HRT68_06365 [Flavobacteriaceae bacterium]|nr:hypothetical protein [Flavobacteriaceae bacterium]
MIKRLTLIALLFFVAGANAQIKKKEKMKARVYKEKPKPKVDQTELNAFVLNGYKIVTYSYGDFNDDKKQDAVLLLKKIDEEKLAETSDKPIERPLLVLIRGEDGKLTKVARNDRAVYCYKCGSNFGSPLTDILIEGNQFSIQHEAGKTDRWTRLISFEYSKISNSFSLFKDATSTYSISGGTTVENEVKTKKDFGDINFEEFDVYSEDLKQKKA